MAQETQHVKIINNPLNITRKIIEFILFKNRITKTPTNIDNKLFLNGVNFWLSQHKQTGETYLMYDHHPNDWDVEGIKNTIDYMSHDIYTSTGIIAP